MTNTLKTLPAPATITALAAPAIFTALAAPAVITALAAPEAVKALTAPARETTIRPTIAELERLFAALNDRYFDGKLERPIITIDADGGSRAYGWFTTWRAWQDTKATTADIHKDGHFEINVTAEYLNRPISESAGTMLHEMIHLYNHMNGKKDTSRNGHYHNKKFKDAATSHGLLCSKDDTYGWTITSLTEEAAKFVFGLNIDIQYNRVDPRMATSTGTAGEDGEGEPVKKRSNSIKYVCPVCGAIIRATREVNMICGDCMENMVGAD